MKNEQQPTGLEVMLDILDTMPQPGQLSISLDKSDPLADEISARKGKDTLARKMARELGLIAKENHLN